MKKTLQIILLCAVLSVQGFSQSACSCYHTPDATYTLAMGPSDEGSSALITLPFTFCYYGTNYSSLYINNNGNITLGAPYGSFYFAFPSSGYVMISPFGSDVDTRPLGAGTVEYKVTATAIYVNWEGVGYYSYGVDLLNTFQCIITDGSDPVLPAGKNLAFCYGDMQWTSGDASGGGGTGLGGTAAVVGLNKGDGITSLLMGQFNQAGTMYDGPLGANDGVSWLDYNSLYFDACTSTNMAPIPSGIGNCDTIKICGIGDTLLLNGIFLSPEASEITSIVINLNSTPGASILSNVAGNTATSVVQIIASTLNAGNNIITYTATDNGLPAGVTTVNVNVFIDTSNAVIPNPTITGSLALCAGGSTTLSVVPTIYDSYLWTTGSNAFNTSITAPGMYSCTATLNGCERTSSVNVTQHNLPTPAIAGYPFTCTGGTTLLYSDSLIYNWYSWCCPSSNNDSVMATNGTWYLTVMDANGCVGTSTAVTVTGPPTPIITGQTALCNGANAVLTTPLSYVSYQWLPTGITNDTAIVGAGTYTLAVTDVNGCNLTSAPVTVTPFTYTLTISGATVSCVGQPVYITSLTTSIPAAIPSYLWTNGQTVSTANANFPGPFGVVATFPNGCTADTNFIVPPPNPLPTPVITGSHFNCDSSAVVLGVDSAYVSYNWGGIASTTNTVTVYSGSYIVTVTDANGCTGTSPAVTIADISTAVFPVFHVADSLYTNFDAGVHYQWVNCNTGYSAIAGADSVSYHPTTNGSYAVVTSIAECKDTSACVTVANVGVEENYFSAGVSIAPNPTAGVVVIRFAKAGEKTILITNILGQPIYNRKLTAPSATAIDMSEQSNGIYFIRITDEKNNVVNKKIIKQ